MSALRTRLVHPPPVPVPVPEMSGERVLPSSTPIYQTATFILPPTGEARWDYSRSGNPTRDVLEMQLAALDGAEHSLAYGSGMAAVTAVLRLARPGEEILVGDDLYGGTGRMLAHLEEREGIEVHRVDARDPAALCARVTPRTALVFVETPTNPRLRTVDIEALAAALAATRGSVPVRRPRLAVDNSMLSPYWQRPLAQGADLAVQSATKLLGGHGDLTAGVVSVRDAALGAELVYRRNAEGTALAPFEAWLLLRGLETLAVRLDQQRRTTRRVAEFLRQHHAVRRVYTPDSPSPGGVVISFETGSPERSRQVLAATRLFRTTVSFGAVTSSISLPWAMSHASLAEADRRASGLTPDLVRLSVGLEDPDDLLADLAAALDTAQGSVNPDAVPFSAGSRGSKRSSGWPG